MQPRLCVCVVSFLEGPPEETGDRLKIQIPTNNKLPQPPVAEGGGSWSPRFLHPRAFLQHSVVVTAQCFDCSTIWQRQFLASLVLNESLKRWPFWHRTLSSSLQTLSLSGCQVDKLATLSGPDIELSKFPVLFFSHPSLPCTCSPLISKVLVSLTHY